MEFLRTHPRLSDEKRAQVLVNFHQRLAMPWMCLIVVLFGIPFGATTGRRGAFLGIVAALALFFVYYLLLKLGIVMGNRQFLAPWLAGWLPNLAFSAMGVILVYRHR